jgi:hypothetical protein
MNVTDMASSAHDHPENIGLNHYWTIKKVQNGMSISEISI